MSLAIWRHFRLRLIMFSIIYALLQVVIMACRDVWYTWDQMIRIYYSTPVKQMNGNFINLLPKGKCTWN